MTRELNIEVGGRASAQARDELRRRLLALVLAAVLVWYTVVIPSSAPARASAARVPEDEGQDGEAREGVASGRRGDSRPDLRAYLIAVAAEGVGVGPAAAEGASETDEDASESVEDLDWPEYIYPD
jgi:hypothetical protein